MWHEILINMVKLNIAIMRSIKTHSQINGDASVVLNKNGKQSQKEAQTLKRAYRG